MPGPTAVGFSDIPYNFRRASVPQDPLSVLQELLRENTALRARLAPVQIMQEVSFNNVAAGTKVGAVTLSGPFNTILNCLVAGTVNVYFGGDVKAVPDMQLSGTLTPIPIPFPQRQDQQVTFAVDSASASAAFGKIFVENY